MSLTLITQKEMPLLKRTRYTFEWQHPGASTPTKITIKEAVAKHLKTTVEHVALRHIYTNYGSNTSKIIVHVYNDQTVAPLLEPPKGKKAAKPEAK